MPGRRFAAGATIFTNNDIPNDFQLNRLNFTYGSRIPFSQTDVSISGNRLEIL